MIRAGTYDLTTRDVTSLARDFIKKMLHLDPTQRMTIREAIDHPFVAGQANPFHTIVMRSPMISNNNKMNLNTSVLSFCII